MAKIQRNIPDKYMNPYVDEGFKRLFGRKGSENILLFFLNSLFQGNPEIKSVEYKNNENQSDVFGGRTIVHDVYCTTSTDEHIIVEMQNNRHINFEERCVYYMSGGITRQAKKGTDWAFDIKGVYGVFFTDFTLEPNKEQLVSRYLIKNTDTNEPFTDKWRMIFINLPQMKKKEEECVDDLEKFIYVFKNMSTMETMPFIKEKKIWKEIEDLAVLNAMTDEEYFAYEQGLNNLRIARLKEREYAEINAKCIRMEEECIRMEEGIAQMERNLRKMATSMLQNGMDVETVSNLSGLSKDEIQKLIN